MDVRLLLKKGIVKKKVGEGGFINYCYLKAVKRISFELNSYYICRPFSFWKALLLFRHNIFIEFFFQFDFLFYMFLIGVFFHFDLGFHFDFHFIFISFWFFRVFWDFLGGWGLIPMFFQRSTRLICMKFHGFYMDKFYSESYKYFR